MDYGGQLRTIYIYIKSGEQIITDSAG